MVDGSLQRENVQAMWELFFSDLFFFPSVLGLELRAFAFSHSTSPIFVMGFPRQGLENYLPGLALNHDPPDLCLLKT
jgi:hypothetical protein